MSKTINGTFSNPQNVPAGNATLALTLSGAAVVSGTTQVVPSTVYIPLTPTGTIPPNTTIWANDELSPSGTTYQVSVTAPGGGLIYGPQYFQLTGSNPININTLIPTTPPTSGTPIYSSAVLTNPTTAQTISTYLLNTEGGLSTPSLDNIIFVDGTTYTSIASALAAVNTVGGGTVVVPPNYSETWSANLVFTTSNTGILFMGPATISMGSYQITQASGLAGTFIKSVVPYAHVGTAKGVVFTYTGSGNAFSIGDSSGYTHAMVIENIGIVISGAGSSAVGLYLDDVITSEINGVTVTGAGGSTSQIGISLTGTGFYCGDNIFRNCFTSACYIGAQLGNQANANTFLGGSFESSVSNAIGIYCNAGSGNTFINPDIETTYTGISMNNCFSNRVVNFFNQGNTTDVILSSSTNGNHIETQGNSAPIFTDSGTWNTIVYPQTFQIHPSGGVSLAGSSSNSIKISAPASPASGSVFTLPTESCTATGFVAYLDNLGETTGGTATLYTPTVAGFYVVNLYYNIARAATNSSSIACSVGWNDGEATQSTSFSAITGNSTSAGNYVQSGVRIYSAASQAITVTATYSSSGATAMEYNLYVRVEFWGN
jgi:hypothetical protein